MQPTSVSPDSSHSRHHGIAPLVLAVVLSLGGGGCLIADFDGGDGSACDPGFDDGQGCPSECDASSTVFIDGSAYCTTTCGDDFECPSGHVCFQFEDGRNPPNACLPPCFDGADCPSGFRGICGPEGICGV